MPSKMAQFQAVSFNMAYTLSDTKVRDGKVRKRLAVVFMLIEMFQAIRVICPGKFGWNPESVQFFQTIDIIFALTDIVSKLIPRWWLMCVSGTVIIGTIGCLVALTRSLRSASARANWPKITAMLRMAIKAQSGFLFISLFQWSLMPFDCSIWDENRFSMSKVFHTDAEPCRPWQSPEIVVTVIGIVLAVAFVLFCKYTCTFMVEVNPLCRRPMAMWTTQVESRWLLTRVAFVVSVYLSAQISEIGASIVATLLGLTILRMHINILPFQDDLSNYVRGGSYAAVTCACASSALLAIIGNDGRSQTLQWVLIVLCPVGFLGGLSMVKNQRRGITNSLNRLRGEYEAQEVTLNLKSAGLHSPLYAKRYASSDRESARGGRASVGGSRKNAPQGGGHGTSRTLFDKFFDVAWETKRAFSSDMSAVVTGRELLNNRSESELDFLEYLMSRGLDEHPGSASILLFKIAVLHYVIQDRQRAAQLEKEARKKNESFPTTQKYILFAIAQNTDQEMVNHAWGNNGMTVSKLVEIDASVDRARRAHLQCLVKLKSFWKQVRRLHRNDSKPHKAHDGSEGIIQSADERNRGKVTARRQIKAKNLMADLAAFDEQMVEARSEYEILLEKYPSSIPVLQTCAAFYDVIVNDFRFADELNERVTTIYNKREAHVLGEKNAAGATALVPAKDEDGSQTSGAMSSRSITAKHMTNLTYTFLSKEESTLKRIRTVVNSALLLELMIAIGLFFFTDKYLFSTRATINIERMENTGMLRHIAVETCYFIRSQVLATMGHHNHDEWVEAKLQIEVLASEMKNLHRETYEVSGTAMKDYLTAEVESAVLPIRGVWVRTDFSYWNLVNDFIRRMELASTSTEAELEEPSYDLLATSVHKMNIAYCHENIFRSIVPAIDHTVTMYENQVYDFGKLKSIIVIIACVGQGSIIAVLAAYILWWNQKLVSRVQHHAVCVCASLAIPQKYSRRLLTFYEDMEVNLMILQDEDEEMEKEQIMDANQPMHGFENENQDAQEMDQTSIATSEAHTNAKPGESNVAAASEIQCEVELPELPVRIDKSGSLESKEKRKDSITFDADVGDGLSHSLEGRHERERLEAAEKLSPALLEQIRAAIRKQVAWFQRWQVILIAAMIMIGLTALSVAYPSAEIPHLVNLAPTANQASRRRVLIVTIAHLIREMVLDDGFTRLSLPELSGAIQHNLEELKKADKAVRLGHALNVKEGADHHSPEHNELMYSVNCLWKLWDGTHAAGSGSGHRRSDSNSSWSEPSFYKSRGISAKRAQRRAETLERAGRGWHRRAGGSTSTSSHSFDPSICSNISRQDAVQNGLYYLLLSFYDSVENVLARYGTEESDWDKESYLLQREGEAVASMYTHVQIKTDRQDLLDIDPDVVFILGAIEGDLFQGMGLALEDFNLEMPRILAAAHFELEVTFSVLVIWIILVFYFMLFRPSMNLAFAELEMSRQFLLRLPLHQFPIREVDQIVAKVSLSSQQLYTSPIFSLAFQKSKDEHEHDDD